MRASAVVAIAALGCGGEPCRQALAQEPVAAPTAAPHGELVLPHALLDRVLAEAMAGIDPVALPLPPALRILGVPEIEIAASRVTIEPAATGEVAAAIDLVAEIAGARLPIGAVTIEATPRLVTEGDRHVLEVSFAGDAIRSFDPGAAHRAIWARTYRTLPSSVRDRLGLVEFVAAVALVARHLGDAGFDLVRTHLLSRIEKVAQIAVTLPELPLARTAVRTRSSPLPALVVSLWTDLGVSEGLETARPAAPATTGQLRLSASAIAAIGNWAIATGQAPRRHDRELRPDPRGEYVPRFYWRRGDRRPLAIEVARLESPCGVIRVAGRPTVSVAGGEIEVGMAEGVVERVDGSVAVKLGVWASRLFRGAINKSRARASTTTFRVAGITLASTVRRAELRGDTVILGINLLARPD